MGFSLKAQLLVVSIAIALMLLLGSLMGFGIVSPDRGVYGFIAGAMWINGLTALGLIAHVAYTMHRQVQAVKSVFSSMYLEIQGRKKIDLALRAPVLGRDELGMLTLQFNDLITIIQQTVTHVYSNINSLLDASVQLTITILQIADASKVQAEAAQDIAKAIETLTVNIQQVAANASLTLQNVSDSGTLAVQGEKIVHEAAVTIQGVAEAVAESSQLLGALHQLTTQIGGIIGMIREITDQTNLLALNAAIEAARASDQGKGFAVVANEVRNLSSRTANAAGQIADMIHKIQDEAAHVVTSMDDARSRVADGVTLASQGAESLAKIRQDAGDTVRKVTEIATATHTQNTATTQVAHNIDTVANMVAQADKAIRQSSESSRKLLQMAMDLESVAITLSPDVSTLTKVFNVINQVRANATLAANASSADSAKACAQAIEKLDVRLAELWKRFMEEKRDDSAKALAHDVIDKYAILVEARNLTLQYAMQGDFKAAKENVKTNAGAKFQAVRAALIKLVEYSGEMVV